MCTATWNGCLLSWLFTETSASVMKSTTWPAASVSGAPGGFFGSYVSTVPSAAPTKLHGTVSRALPVTLSTRGLNGTSAYSLPHCEKGGICCWVMSHQPRSGEEGRYAQGAPPKSPTGLVDEMGLPVVAPSCVIWSTWPRESVQVW